MVKRKEKLDKHNTKN